MFAVPNAKRVRRADLDFNSSRSSSPSLPPSPSAIDRFRSQAPVYFEEKAPTTTVLPDQSDSDSEGGAFRLFAGAKAPQAVRLRSASPSGDGGSGRPVGYYLRGELDAETVMAFDAAAVSGEEVRRRARLLRPGSVYAWKVIAVPAKEKISPESQKERRTRPGKKTRLRKRKVADVLKAKKASAAEEKEAKDRMDREKRAKRNREKKFKKRARDKLKKQASEGEGTTAPADETSGSGSDDEGMET